MALQGLFTPVSSDRICTSSLPALRSTNTWRKPFGNTVLAIAYKRDNLDHFQRAGSHRAQQVQSKRAPSVVWDRFPTAKTVQQMMDTMERLMQGPSWPSPSERMRDGYGHGRMPWAIKEREGDYRMRFDMPGMSREDVNVWVEDNVLVVKAEKAVNGSAAKDEEEEWPAKSYGKYSFRIALPENIELEKIKAEVKDGVLAITVPKASSSSSRVLDISVQ